MKILITGSNGQLGTELGKILRNGISELGPIPRQLLEAELRCIDVEDLDITAGEEVCRYIQDFAPDLILNCAAYTNVDACESNRDDAFKVNALGPRNLAVCAERIGAKLVHLSTDYVFSGDGTTPYREYDLPSPRSVYGASKLAGEQYVRDFSIRWFIIRTSWLYGYAGRNFVKTILKYSRERSELNVVDDQRGNPTNAADLAHHVLKIAATEEYGVYHCTGGGECSWYEFARRIVGLSGASAEVKPCSTDEYPSSTRRPPYSSLDNMMLRLTVGDEMRNWEDALQYFLQNFKGE